MAARLSKNLFFWKGNPLKDYEVMQYEAVRRGKECLEQLRLDEAEACFVEALAKAPSSVEARLWLCRLHWLRQEWAVGLRWVEEALELAPEHPELIALRAIEYRRAEDWEQAIAWLERARALAPELSMVYSNLAPCYRELGRFEEAETTVRRALDLDPTYAPSHYELGYILALQGRLQEAMDSTHRALEHDPLHLRSYLTLGSLYKEAGQWEEVIGLFEEGLQHAPVAHPLREELCELYLQVQQPALSLEHALTLAEQRDGFRDHLRVGKAAMELDQSVLAERAFRISLVREPSSWEGHFQLGELYFRASRLELARDAYQNALALEEGAFVVWNGLGLTLLHLGELVQARDALLQAQDVSPERLESHFNLALCDVVEKKFEEAESKLQMILDSTKRGTPLYEEAARLLMGIEEERAMRPSV